MLLGCSSCRMSPPGLGFDWGGAASALISAGSAAYGAKQAKSLAKSQQAHEAKLAQMQMDTEIARARALKQSGVAPGGVASGVTPWLWVAGLAGVAGLGFILIRNRRR